MILDALQDIRIVPKHVVEPELARLKDDINEFNKLKFDKNPVGSGPYRLHLFSGEKVVTSARRRLLGHQGALRRQCRHRVHRSPDLQAERSSPCGLAAGTARCIFDVRAAHLAQAEEGRAELVPEGAVLHSVGGTDAVRQRHEEAARRPHLRRAMAFSINYRDIRELAVSVTASRSSLHLPDLPFGLEAKYYNAEDAQQYGATVFDPARAKAELKAGGYQPVWDAEGKLVETRDKNGRSFPRSPSSRRPAGATGSRSCASPSRACATSASTPASASSTPASTGARRAPATSTGS